MTLNIYPICSCVIYIAKSLIIVVRNCFLWCRIMTQLKIIRTHYRMIFNLYIQSIIVVCIDTYNLIELSLDSSPKELEVFLLKL